MDPISRKRWLRTVTILGVAYFVIWFGLAEMAKTAPDQLRFAVRLTAWIASALVFAAHIGYEHFTRRSSPQITALHTALAVALGAFLLALAATAHALMVPSHAPYYLYFLAWVIWPMVTAVPAFLIAFVASAGLRHLSCSPRISAGPPG